MLYLVYLALIITGGILIHYGITKHYEYKMKELECRNAYPKKYSIRKTAAGIRLRESAAVYFIKKHI